MKNIIKVLLVVMTLALVVCAFAACDQPSEQPTPEAPCTHEGTEGFRSGVNPTCTETGLTVGSYCTACGADILPQEVAPALGHAFTVDVPAKDATCDAPGYNAHKQCERCDEVEGKEETEALGHDMVAFDKVDATCTTAGHEAGEKCSRCDHTTGGAEIAALGHNMVAFDKVDATCTTAGHEAGEKCSRCGHTTGGAEIAALGHNYVDGVCGTCKGVVTYFVNVGKWANVYAHMWNASGDITSWPGIKMTKTGETVNGYDVYMIESAKVPANIIFNNNAGAQTADLAFVAGKYFSMLNATWYDNYEDVPQFTTTTYYLPGAFNSWNQTGNQFVKEGTSTVIRSYIALDANKTYEFKVKNGSSWYGYSGTYTATTASPFTLSASNSNNIKVTTKCAGIYVFEFDTSSRKLTIIYPHTEVVVEGKDATCTETGLTDGKKCSVCGTVTVKQTVIPTTEHAWLDAEAVIKECGDCGLVWNSHFEGGKGTAEEPYLIKTAEQLANITHYYGTYTYFKVADGVKTIDMTGVGKLSLHGSFDGNGVKLVNLTTALFEKVGYNNSVEEIKISNVDATMNNTDGRAFVRNIFNGGKTTFENVALHGYIEGLYNMGSFYNYGTANLGGSEGADYTVEFLNSTSDVTLVCTSGNVAGGFAGHTYEGAGNSFTMIITNSSFTGKILTTTGKGNLYFTMTSDYNNANNKFIVDGEEIHFNNGQIPAAANLGKITVATPVAGETTYGVEAVEGAASFVVYLNAQVSAHNEDGTYVANHNGMTWPLGKFSPEELAGYGLVTSAKIVNGTDHEFGFDYAEGVLTIYSGRSDNYCSGNVYLQINQYDAEGNLLATGTLKVATIEHPHTFVGGDCTTDGVCGCGAKQAATGHVWSDVEAKAPTCTAAGYTAHKGCEECGATEGKETVDKIAHADNNGDYKCDACSTKMLPADGTALTIVEAIKVAKAAGTSYSTQKYYITGIIKNVYNEQYGNMYIKDEAGNELCIYGLYTWDKAVRYDKMDYKPVEGDELTVYTVLGMYNTTCQGKDAWVDEVVHNHIFSAATCTEAGKCSCGETSGAALGHNYVEGVCSRCSGVDPDYEGEVSAPTYKKITSASELTTGTYVLVVNGYVMTKFDSSTSWVLAEKFTTTGDTIVSDSIATWTLTVNGSSVTLKDAKGTFIKPKAGNNNGIQSGSYNWAWSISNGKVTFKGTGSDTTTLAFNKQESKIRAYKNTTASNTTSYPSTFEVYKLVTD